MDIRIVAIVIFLIGLIIGTVFYLKSELFSQDYTGPETYVKSSDFIPEDPSVLSNGTVQKYKEGELYSYELFFNLPAIGSSFQTLNLDVPFNQPLKTEEYIVKMGTSVNDLTQVGVLTRRTDGNHVLKLESRTDYSKVCVYIGNTLVNCVDF